MNSAFLPLPLWTVCVSGVASFAAALTPASAARTGVVVAVIRSLSALILFCMVCTCARASSLSPRASFTSCCSCGSSLARLRSACLAVSPSSIVFNSVSAKRSPASKSLASV